MTQLIKGLINEGYEVESEEQITYLLRYPDEKVNKANDLNRKVKEELINKDKYQVLKIDIYDSIEKLGGLLDKGYISQEEFNEKKKKLLDQL